MRRVLAMAVLLLASCAQNRPALPQPSTQPAPAFHVHLPGIGGYRSIDRMFLQGLHQGGLDAEFHPYDWTAKDPGLSALLATETHKQESAKLAVLLRDLAAAHPGARITVSVHSGGAGIIAWALEQLPEHVMIDSLMLLSPALSPQYDLSKALRHVRNRAYVIYSPYDAAVLGIGTRMFGTIDGIKTDAAGKVGFAKPDSADQAQYAKLIQVRYDPAWIRVGNIGDHIGTLTRPFARRIVAPLMLTGNLPNLDDEPLKTPATLPAGAPPDPPEAPTTRPAAPR